MTIFHDLGHSSLLIWIIKQNKNNWGRNYMKYSYNSLQFWYGSLIKISKNLREKPRTDENI